MALHALGDERETPEQQRRLLLDVVATFQDITQQALTTNYGVRDIFDSDPALRLATLIATRNAAFAADLAVWGHTYAFKSQKDDMNQDHKDAGDGDKSSDENPQAPDRPATSSRKVANCEDLEEIVHEESPIERSIEAGITAWIGKLYKEARGFEIGTFNHVLLSTLIKRQSAKWPNLARGYVSDIITTVHTFIQKALRAASRDSKISENILSLLMDDLMDKYRGALSAVDFLLDIERAGTPMTLNHYLNDNIQKW